MPKLPKPLRSLVDRLRPSKPAPAPVAESEAQPGLHSPPERGTPDPEPAHFNVGDPVVAAAGSDEFGSGARAVGDARRKPLPAEKMFTIIDGTKGVVKGVDDKLLFVEFAVTTPAGPWRAQGDIDPTFQAGMRVAATGPVQTHDQDGAVLPKNTLGTVEAVVDDNTLRVRVLFQFRKTDWWNAGEPGFRQWGWLTIEAALEVSVMRKVAATCIRTVRRPRRRPDKHKKRFVREVWYRKPGCNVAVNASVACKEDGYDTIVLKPNARILNVSDDALSLKRTAALDDDTRQLVEAVKSQAMSIERLSGIVDQLLGRMNAGSGYDAIKTEDRLIVLNPAALESGEQPKRRRWLKASKQAQVNDEGAIASLERVYELEFKLSRLEQARERGPLADRTERTLVEWRRVLSRLLDTELQRIRVACAMWLREVAGVDPVTHGRIMLQMLDSVEESGGIRPEEAAAARRIFELYNKIRTAPNDLKQKLVLFHVALSTAHTSGGMADWAYGQRSRNLLDELSNMDVPAEWTGEVKELLSLPRGAMLVINAASMLSLKRVGYQRYEGACNGRKVRLSRRERVVHGKFPANRRQQREYEWHVDVDGEFVGVASKWADAKQRAIETCTTVRNAHALGFDKLAGPERIEYLKKKYPEHIDSVEGVLHRVDPTAAERKYQYADWIARQVFTLGESEYSVKPELKTFHELQKYIGKTGADAEGKPVNKYHPELIRFSRDINTYKTLVDLNTALREIEPRAAKAFRRDKATAGVGYDKLLKAALKEFDRDDPSNSNDYLQWAMNTFSSERADVEGNPDAALELIRRIQRVYGRYHLVRQKSDEIAAVTGNDLPKLSVTYTLHQAEKLIAGYEELLGPREPPTPIFEDDHYKVYDVRDKATSCVLCRGQWCVSDFARTNFEDYTKGDDWRFIMVLSKHDLSDAALNFMMYMRDGRVEEVKDGDNDTTFLSEFPTYITDKLGIHYEPEPADETVSVYYLTYYGDGDPLGSYHTSERGARLTGDDDPYLYGNGYSVYRGDTYQSQLDENTSGNAGDLEFFNTTHVYTHEPIYEEVYIVTPYDDDSHRYESFDSLEEAQTYIAENLEDLAAEGWQVIVAAVSYADKRQESLKYWNLANEDVVAKSDPPSADGQYVTIYAVRGLDGRFYSNARTVDGLTRPTTAYEIVPVKLHAKYLRDRHGFQAAVNKYDLEIGAPIETHAAPWVQLYAYVSPMLPHIGYLYESAQNAINRAAADPGSAVFVFEVPTAERNRIGPEIQWPPDNSGFRDVHRTYLNPNEPQERTAAGLVDLKGLDKTIARALTRAIHDASVAAERVSPLSPDWLAYATALAREALNAQTLGDLYTTPILRDKHADKLFNGVVLRIRPGTPGGRTHGQFQNPYDYIGAITINIADALSGYDGASPNSRGVYQAIEWVVTHELRHAADWAYQEAARPGMWTDNLATFDEASIDSNWAAYINLDTELKSRAGDVAQLLWRRFSDRALKLSGGQLVEGARQLAPSVMDAIEPGALRAFMQRVVKDLQARAQQQVTTTV